MGIRRRRPYKLDEDYTFEFNSVAFEELFGGKIKALLERSAARDLYDVSMLTRASLQYDVSSLRKISVLFGVTSKLDWRRMDFRTIDEIDQKMLDNELTPLLKRNQARSFETIKSDSKRILTMILDYNENEKKFLDKFLDYGEYEPHLLFENEQAQRLKNHPAVLWKLQNLRKFKGLD